MPRHAFKGTDNQTATERTRRYFEHEYLHTDILKDRNFIDISGNPKIMRIHNNVHRAYAYAYLYTYIHSLRSQILTYVHQ